MSRLSKNLQPIYELELRLGNEVLRVDEPAGTACPLAIVFQRPLHFKEAEQKGLLRDRVRQWENKDPHYPPEAGYMCEETRHALAVPLK